MSPAREEAGQFGVKAGTSYSSFDGNTDNIIVNSTSFDFEAGGSAATLNVRSDGVVSDQPDTICNGSANVAGSNDCPEISAHIRRSRESPANSVAGDTIDVIGHFTEQVTSPRI